MTKTLVTNAKKEKSKNSDSFTTTQPDNHINPEKRTYAGIDIFKFLFAVCIVALHTNALNFLPDMANYMITKILFRVAVPFFFVASGFFLGEKLLHAPKEQYPHIIRTYCLRLLKPLIVFESVSLLYYGANYLFSGQSLFATAQTLVKSIIFYPYGALWFVQACIVGALLLYPFLKRDKLKLALVIGVVLYGFALIANNYSFLIIDTPFHKIVATYMEYCVSARNGLFTGFISLALGILCSKIWEKDYKINYQVLTLVFFVLYVLEILIIFYFNKTPLDDGALYISQLLFVPSLFLTTLRLNIQMPSKIAVLLRNLSTGIYFLHRPILYVVDYLISEEPLRFVVVLCLAILICLFAYKSRFKFLSSLLK